MENLDTNLEQRVWQRVRGQQEPEGQTLQALCVGERSAAAVYLMLARTAQGREKEMLRKLSQRERGHADCLNGIGICSCGEPLSARTAAPRPERAQIALRKCYAGSLRAAREYESRTEDREYGAVFDYLARQERENCVMILEILGGMGQ